MSAESYTSLRLDSCVGEMSGVQSGLMRVGLVAEDS